MVARTTLFVLHTPPGLNCSHPDVVAAEARFVAHVSDADVESPPTTPVERDLRHSLARREARKVDRESVAEFIAGAQATCERLAPEQAGECRSRVDRAAAALLAY